MIDYFLIEVDTLNELDHEITQKIVDETLNPSVWSRDVPPRPEICQFWETINVRRKSGSTWKDGNGTQIHFCSGTWKDEALNWLGGFLKTMHSSIQIVTNNKGLKIVVDSIKE